MKKILLSCVTAFLACNLLAQSPVIDGSYLPVNNTVISQVYNTDSTHLLFVPLENADETWDYSGTFPPADTFSLRTLHPDSAAPYNSVFPGATHSSFLRTPFNSIADSLYTFFWMDTSGFFAVGVRSIKKQTVMNGYNVKLDTNFFANPYELVMPFSISYGQEIPDSSVTFGDIQVEMAGSWYNTKIETTKRKTIAGVGYGDLIHPTGVLYHDVLLGKETIYTDDYLEVDIFNDGTYYPIDALPPPYTMLSQPQPSTDTTYKHHFLRNNTFGTTHLLQIESNGSGIIKYGWYTLPAEFGHICGTVYNPSGITTVSAGTARLYREYSNFTENDLLAETAVQSDGTYQFDSIPYGHYRVAVRYGSANAAANTDNVMTTYFGQTASWSLGDTLITSSDTCGIDITMIQENSPANGQGNAFGGHVEGDDGINKTGAAAGDPVPGVDLALEQVPGGIVYQIEANESGDFLMDSIAPGTYRLIVDVPGKHHASTYEFTVNGNTSVTDLNFVVGFDSVHAVSTPIIDSTSYIKEQKAKHQLAVYPNPFSDKVHIQLDTEDNVGFKVEITDLVGRFVDAFSVSRFENKTGFTWDGKGLKDGYYFVVITMPNGFTYQEKLLKR